MLSIGTRGILSLEAWRERGATVKPKLLVPKPDPQAGWEAPFSKCLNQVPKPSRHFVKLSRVHRPSQPSQPTKPSTPIQVNTSLDQVTQTNLQGRFAVDAAAFVVQSETKLGFLPGEGKRGGLVCGRGIDFATIFFVAHSVLESAKMDSLFFGPVLFCGFESEVTSEASARPETAQTFSLGLRAVCFGAHRSTFEDM